MTAWHELFARRQPLVGVLHLPPLPGTPGHDGNDLDKVAERALGDLAALTEGGVDGVIVENFGDAPFAKHVDKATVAQMAVLTRELCRNADIPIGVNVLRSDGQAAVAIAAASGGCFVRINVFSGVAFTDQGIVEGEARDVLALRQRLGARIAVLADVHVKHAVHLGTLRDAARDAARNGADALIVTGAGTGEGACPDEIREAQRASGLPVLVGSGMTNANARSFAHADGFIVGTAFKKDGHVRNPVDLKSVQGLRNVLFS